MYNIISIRAAGIPAAINAPKPNKGFLFICPTENEMRDEA